MNSEQVDIPAAQLPDRVRQVDAHGVRLAVHEWGEVDAPPVALVHGGFDFARTFDVFAPLLAAAGWRVVAWDQRGHGDSEHAALYSWGADVRDAVAVLDTVSAAPLPVVGHSKGGSLMLDLASTLPGRVERVVNMDGIPSPRNWPDVPDHQRTKLMAGDLATWLDVRRSTVDAVRKPGTIAELADRRGRMNSRLSTEWLRYLVTVGARQDEDGWRWKIDPTMRLGGFGPFRPAWAMERLALLNVPVLALLGLQPEMMGWGTRAEDVEPKLPPGGRVVELDDVGHFIHVEQPVRVADMVLDFLGPPDGARGSGRASGHTVVANRRADVVVRHNRVDLALHRLRDATDRDAAHDDPVAGTSPPGTGNDGIVAADGARSAAGSDVGDADTANTAGTVGAGAVAGVADGGRTVDDGGNEPRPLLHLHGLGEHTPAAVPTHLEAWPGPVWGLDFTGHGASSRAVGGGYFAEILMGDVDLALSHLGRCTLYGRGLGAYVALLIAGARPDLVRGAVLDDGPGLHGGSEGPSSAFIQTEPFTNLAGGPDPYALLELSRDIRPADYAATFARQAATLSGLEVALAVVGAVRPPWLEAVIKEPGLRVVSRQQALELFAAV